LESRWTMIAPVLGRGDLVLRQLNVSWMNIFEIFQHLLRKRLPSQLRADTLT